MQTTSQPTSTLFNQQLIVTLTEQNELLSEQVNLLRQLLAHANEAKLGLHNNVGIQKIYCNRTHNCLWYSLDRERQPIPITESGLTGYLRRIKFEKVERRGQEVSKLLTTIVADRTYILESGHDSHFSKCLLASIASLTPDQLRAPITIAPLSGDDASVLFCNVWLGNERCLASYNDETDWKAISIQALSKVKAVENVQ
jgi:hypothetical protein